MFRSFACLVVLFFAVPSHADTELPLGQYLLGEMSPYLDLMSEGPGDANVCYAKPEVEEMWRFQRFFLRLRPRVVLTAGIAKISIIPDIEVYWERAMPEGWAFYRP